jgi:hypothetical protein
VVSAGLLVAFALPYLLVDQTAVGVYYTRGVTNGYAVGLAGGGALVLFALTALDGEGGLLVDGVLAGLCLGVLVLAGVWALTVPPVVVMGLSELSELAYHRFALLAIGGVVALVGLWNATEAYADAT